MKKIIYLLLLLSLFLVACGEKKSDTTSTENKIVTVAQGAKPKSLDPYMYNSIPDLMVSRQFYNTLFSREKMELLYQNLLKVMNIKMIKN